MVTRKVLKTSDYYISQIRNFLENKGYDVDGPVELFGKSGNFHTIDIMIIDSKNRTFMGKYILSGAFIDEEIIFRIFGISFDMDVDGVFLFVLPQLTVRAVELADFYGFKVIDVSNLKNLSRIQE